MEGVKENVLLIIVVVVVIISIASPLLIRYSVDDISTGKTSAGSISLVVPSICGNGDCEFDETCINCDADCGVCPVELPASAPSGGGGSSSTRRDVVNFEFDPQYIEERMAQGEYITKIIKVKNKGNKDIRVDLEVDRLIDFIFLTPDKLVISKGKIEEFQAYFSVSQSTDPGVYIGSIIGEDEDVKKTLPIVLTVYEEEGPFQVDVTIPEDYRTVYPGDFVLGQVEIINKLADFTSVNIEYSIKNQGEKIISTKDDIVGLDAGLNSFEEIFGLDEDLDPGYYLFFVSVDYDSRKYEDAAIFKVGSRERFPLLFQRYALYSIIILLAIGGLIFFFLKRRKKKDKKMVTMIKIEDIDKNKLIEETIEKLNEVKKSGDVDNFFKIMRHFFAKFYSVRSSLTFEELESSLGKKNVKNKLKVISFIKRISHIPYQSKEVSKTDLNEMTISAMSLLNGLKSRKKTINPKKKKKVSKRRKRNKRQ
jgi:hypothetical protein